MDFSNFDNQKFINEEMKTKQKNKSLDIFSHMGHSCEGLQTNIAGHLHGVIINFICCLTPSSSTLGIFITLFSCLLFLQF